MSLRLDIAALTARTATIRFVQDGAYYHLSEPLEWVLTAVGLKDCHGETRRVVTTLDSLNPATNYTLTCTDAILYFRTPDCEGLVDIRQFGADETLPDNGPAMTAAINAAPAGGTVFVPAGIWRTAPLFLKSDVSLYLAEGAELHALSDRRVFPLLPAHHEDGRMLGTWEGVPQPMYAALICAIDCRNITITGAGTLNGGGADGDWWTWPKETRDGARRARTVFLSNCENVILSGITVCNSPSWTVHPVYCRNVTAADLAIRNPADSPNTDGFNPECSENIMIEGVHFSVGDDCIAIKAGKPDPERRHLKPTRHVTVSHCLMERGHGGVVIGSEMSGSVTDVTISHCHMMGTDRGLRIKTRRGRGGVVDNIRLEHCLMEGVQTALVANAFYFCDADGTSETVQSRDKANVDDTTPNIGTIRISDLKLTDVRIAVGAFLGLPEAPIGPIRINTLHAQFDNSTAGDVPVMACHVPPMLHEGIIADYADVKLTGAIDPQSLNDIHGVSTA